MDFPAFPDLFTIAAWINLPGNALLVSKADIADQNDFFFRIWGGNQVQITLNSPVHTA